MGPHTKTLSKSCFRHIRSFKQIRSSMDHSTAISVDLALVSSRLDYVNSVLSGSPLKHIARLQRAQHALTRVVLQERSCVRSAPLMQQLHWVPVEWRIRFKLATLTHKALHTVRLHISQILYSFTQLESERVHLPISFCSFHVITYHLVHGLYAFSAPKV